MLGQVNNIGLNTQYRVPYNKDLCIKARTPYNGIYTPQEYCIWEFYNRKSDTLALTIGIIRPHD